MYYAINEDLARRAKEMRSFSDYVPGSATAAYRKQVDEAAALAQRQSDQHPEVADKIAGLLDTYSRRLADYINKDNSIGTRCPSVMIAGPANFPVRKKEKQNAAWDANQRFYNEHVAPLLDRIRTAGSYGHSSIKAGEADALDKLRRKLGDLTKLQETMKAVNAYYRKHKTLDGCPNISPETVEKLKAAMAAGWRSDLRPYESYLLQNNNAEIRRLQKRIGEIEQAKAQPATESEGEGYTYKEDPELMRVQFFFDGKPDDETREFLKSHGFRWAPSIGAWQRQLNANGQYAAEKVKAFLQGQ